MLNNLIQYCNIMQGAKGFGFALLDIQQKGKVHLEVLKEMRSSCAFQSEIQSAKLAVFENESHFKEKV